MLALAMVAFGLGRIDGGADGGDTAVRTERVRETAAASGPELTEVRPVLARTATDGTLIRAIEERWEQSSPSMGEWTPPAWCMGSASLSIGLVTDIHVAHGWATVYDDLRDGATAELWGSGEAGYPSMGVVAFAAVRTEDDDLVVRLLHDGDVVDETTPIDGWAIVAAEVPQEGSEVAFGDEVRDLGGNDDNRYATSDCQPPPPRVPEDSEPADAKTVAAVQAALDGVFARDVDDDEPRDPRIHLTDTSRLTDDWMEGMRVAVEPYTHAGTAVEISDVGLTSDDEAVAIYRLVGPPVDWRPAMLERIDGEWKVATDSWCEVIGLVFSCP